MTLLAATGQAQALDGQEAGAAAARQAFNQLGRSHAALGLVAVSHDYPLPQVLSGIRAELGDIPLLGFSTSAEVTSTGPRQHTVVVGLLAGNEFHARADWWPAPESDPQQAVQRMLQALQPGPGHILLVVGDGLGGDDLALIGQLSLAVQNAHPAHTASPDPRGLLVAGCLAEGDYWLRNSYQIGGGQAGREGLAGALIAGKVALGVGAGHGWHPIGTYFRVTETGGRWIKKLDGRPAAETYARLFGHTPEEWCRPPLRELVRLYPFGLEYEGVNLPCSQDCPYLVRTPLWVEADGSLRMAGSIPSNVAAHLLVGSVEACLESARLAAHQALESLAQAAGEARPVLAVVWVDASWQKLLEGQPGSEIDAVRAVLGPGVPILGGYTFGQIVCPDPYSAPALLNQHIQVLLFGETTS
jgi:hypothetical protein